MKSLENVLEKLRSMDPPKLAQDIVEKPQPACPDCEICGGTGWVRFERPVGHPLFGKMERCPNYDLTKDYPEERYGLDREEIRSLKWADLVDYHDSIRLAREAVIETLERGAGWVFLWSSGERDNPGGHGLAKSMILKIAVAESLRARRRGAYIHMAYLMDDLRSAYDERNPGMDAQDRLALWTDIPILALDEFNRVNPTQYVRERQFMLMEKRYMLAERGQAVTLIASNTPPEDQDSYLYDRIRDHRFKIVRLMGRSMRPLMEWDNEH